MTSGDLEGKKVFAQQGREIGVVHAVEVDVRRFRVTALEVKIRREVLEELALKVPLMGSQTVRLDVAHVGAVSDTVVLAATVQELASLVASVEEA